MNQQASFFVPSIYKTDLLRPVDAPPPRATMGHRRKHFAYVGLAAQTAAVVALTMVPVSVTVAAVSDPSSQVLKVLGRRVQTVKPRRAQLETVDFRRVQMPSKHVLIFRPTVRPAKARPRPFRDDAAD